LQEIAGALMVSQWVLPYTAVQHSLHRGTLLSLLRYIGDSVCFELLDRAVFCW